MLPVEALTRRRKVWTETLRVLVLVAAAFYAVLPFLTSRQIGGVDGRWYAYMLRGFTDQIGSGHIPHLLGEGPFAWNGAVHPFRSAPVYMLVGGLWKILTLGMAGAYSLQHLTVLTSAIVGTLGFYRAVTLFVGDRRWTAAAFGLVYLFTPAWLAEVYRDDAYMSYMAFAAMPLVLYGNARTLRDSSGSGYLALGAGLALLWMCHPPIALITTVTTLFIQTAVLMGNGLLRWKQAAAGCAMFAVLAAYYFCSMSELPPRGPRGPSLGSGVVILVGMALFVLGIGRSVFESKRRLWILCAGLGILLIGLHNAPWLWWAAFTGAYCCVAALAAHLKKYRWPADTTQVVIYLCAIAGAASAEAAMGASHPGRDSGRITTLAINTGLILDYLKPLSRELYVAFQPGWAVLTGLGFGVAAMFAPGRLATKVFAAAALTLGMCFLRFPMVSNFLVGYCPSTLAVIAGLPLSLRVTPVFSSFALMTGVLWVAAFAPKNRGQSLAFGLLLFAAVSWSGFEAYPFIRLGYLVTNTPAGTEQSMRSENVMLDRYAYDLLPIPDYYSNGVMDPQLESRLLNVNGDVIVGPQENAALMEKTGAEKIRMTCQTVSGSATWVDIVPQLTLPPGAHELLRFEFDKSQSYDGYLIFSSEHSYREYHLPDAGQPASFGVGGARTNVLSFWNSGQTTEHYRILLNREPGSTLDGNGGFFANLTVSKLDPNLLPVQLVSLDPYHAVIHTQSAATLETFRILLPGYKAFVDGMTVPISLSQNKLLEVPVPAGVHDVIVKFIGSIRLWCSAAVSALAWLGLLLVWLAGKRRDA